jgi:DNA-binding NtrC family response regulator
LLHDSSLRAQQRFVVVTCGAVPPAQFNHELFGQSGNAETSKLGKVAAAGSGTLMLDEIDTLSPEHQSHILRMVETGEYEPVGTHETQHCKARIVASTNGSLAEAVGRGAFRSDLYYRLQVLSFRLPPLRERPQDIPCLVRGMVARFSTKFGKRVAAIHAEAMRALELYPWPGNIRQLENVLQQAVLSSPGEELRLQHLPPIVQNDVNSFRGEGLPKAASGSLAHNRETSERATILRALEKASFSRTRAAKSLGVSRVTLYKKMKKYGLLGKTVGMAQSPLPVPATTSIV